MKLKTTIFTTLALAGLAFTGCDSDNDNNYTPDQKIVSVLNEKYPTAQRVEWELKNNYHVADFYQDGVGKEVWINQNAEWVMTESDIRFDALPEAIQTEFKSSEYKDWKIEDVDLLERTDMEPVYVIEVEQGKTETDLFYAEDGTLVKAVEDTDNDNDDHSPVIVPEVLKATINTKYQGAAILDIEIEKGITEIDILHDGIAKEVDFNSQNEWLNTSWEVLLTNVPEIVKNVLDLPEYSGYTVDGDVDYEERANGINVYIFELEQNGQEIHLTVDTEGHVSL